MTYSADGGIFSNEKMFSGYSAHLGISLGGYRSVDRRSQRVAEPYPLAFCCANGRLPARLDVPRER